jgi:hypothetical protein
LTAQICVLAKGGAPSYRDCAAGCALGFRAKLPTHSVSRLAQLGLCAARWDILESPQRVIQCLRRTLVESSIRASKLKGFMADMLGIVRRALTA